MLRFAGLALLVAAAALAAPGGRVVRIERDRGLKTVPLLCDVQPSAKTGLCIGQPNAGDRVAMVDQDRGIPIGEFRIDSSSAAGDPFSCQGVTPTVFRVTGSITSGEPDLIANAARIVGLRNLTLDAHVAKVLKDATVPGGQDKAELALDIDGNDSVDYMLVRYGCDESGNVVPTADRRFCFDTYLVRNTKLVKVHTDNIQICY